MGIDAVKIGIESRKLLVISVRSCYRTICRHPFLVGMACFLMLLYRSFPFLFSLLVSTSPVLVCTAVLLGTLLSFGKPNLPEIEEYEEEEATVSHEVSQLKSGVVEDATVIVRDEIFSVDRLTQKREDAEVKAEDETSLVEKAVYKVEDGDDFGDYMPLIDESSRDIHFEKQVIEEVERGSDDSEKKRESQEEISGTEEALIHDEVSGNQYTLVSNVEDDENLEAGNDKLLGESTEDKRGDHLDFSYDLSLKRANDDDHDKEDDEEASDSGSDGAESSSPDASMADILPLLDELHPLLNEEAPQLVHVSDDGSDASSEWSHKSKESNVESDDDMERHADDGVDDNDNEEEEEGARRGKEDESKAAIKWTEDDQKNLMDLGTSELERNQRLESLIARRRARKNMRLMAERNLIDLDGFDLPLNVPPISTARHNPFDLPYDDVPGSAPSILMPRRNPFDLPYDSSEEKPDLKGDSFQHEFLAVQQHREPVFRRHESFSIGPSGLGASKQERQDLRWKPYFVPERLSTEGTSYPTFQRQLSEVSESKLSSVPDTDSVNSAMEEDKKLNEDDVSQETEVISNVDLASILVERGSISSEDVNSAYFEKVEERDVQHDEDEITLGDVENHHESDMGFPPSPTELNASEILRRMGAGDEEYSSRSSLSSLSEIDEKIADVKKESTHAEQINSEIEDSDLTQNSLDSDFQFMSTKADENQQREPVTMQTSDFHFTVGYVEPTSEPQRNDIGDSGISKQTSLESDLQLMNVVENEKQEEPALEARELNSGFFRQTSLESDYHSTSRVEDEVQRIEPMYDSSPSTTNKIISFPSISSDTLSETLETSSAPAVTECDDKESAVHSNSMEQDTSRDGKVHESFSEACLPGDNEPRPTEVTEIRETDDTRAELPGSDAHFDAQYVFFNTESVVEQVLVDSPPSSSNNESVTEDVPVMEERSHREQPQMDSLNLDRELIIEAHRDEMEKLEDVAITAEISHHEENQMDSSNLGELITNAHQDEMEKLDSGSQFQMASELDEQHSLVLGDNDSADLKLSSSVAESLDEHPKAVEENVHVEDDQVHLSTTGASNGCVTETEKLDSVASCVDTVPSADLHVSTHEEREPQLKAVQSSEAHYGEEDSLIKEESTLFEQDQLLSSATDAKDIVADFHQDVVVEDRSMPSEESSQNELEKQLSLSDKMIVDPLVGDQHPPMGRCEQLEHTVEETNVADLEASHTKDNMSGNITSLISDSKYATHENLEYESTVGTLDLNINLLDDIVYGDSGHVIEHSSVIEGNVNEMESDMKEIDEGFLSELDTVGDFRVKEAANEAIHNEQILETSTGIPESDLLPHDSSLADIKPELPVLEVTSVEDIELAFKQIHEGSDVEDVILPSMIEEQMVVEQSEGHRERNSGIQFVEASSLADIDTAMKQFSQGIVEEQPATLHFEHEPEKINETSSAKELPVLEVKTTEDIDLAFKQLHEGADIEEVILPSTIEQQLIVDESQNPGQTSSELHIVEARSVEDIQVAIKQLSKVDDEKQAKPSVTEYDSVEENEVGSRREVESRTLEVTDVSSSSTTEPITVEVTETSSVEGHESTTEECSVNKTITDVPHKQEHVSDEAFENMSSGMPDEKDKEKKSHKRSGSSSSSSSSSSDSD